MSNINSFNARCWATNRDLGMRVVVPAEKYSFTKIISSFEFDHEVKQTKLYFRSSDMCKAMLLSNTKSSLNKKKSFQCSRKKFSHSEHILHLYIDRILSKRSQHECDMQLDNPDEEQSGILSSRPSLC